MRLLATLSGIVAPRLPAFASLRRDALRDEHRHALAGFLAAPAASQPPDLAAAAGLSGTPGIGEAIAGHRLLFEGDRAGAAEAFWRAARAIPDIDDMASDEARQWRLSKALALMLLARAAVRAGLADTEWVGLGTAEKVAAAAVALEPTLLHLRFEHAVLLNNLGRAEAAIDTLAEARPAALDATARMRLADAAGEIAAGVRKPGLMNRVERDFVAPLLAAGRDDGPEEPGRDEDEARSWAWVFAFRAGKLALASAEAAQDDDRARAATADRAARRFSRALSLMRCAPQEVPARDRANVAAWHLGALETAAEAALAASLPLAAVRRLRRSDDAGHRAMAARLREWLRAGRPARFAAAGLIGEAAPMAERIACAALARVTEDWRDEAGVAPPPLPRGLVVLVTDPLLADEALAHRIIGGPAGPTVARLRERFLERHGFRLPSVRLRGTEEGKAGRVVVTIDGVEAERRVVPLGGWLVPADASPPGGGVAIGGALYRWAGAEAAGKPGALHPAYALLSALEAAALRRMDWLTGLDEAAAMLPLLPPGCLPDAVRTLRRLFAERVPVLPEVAEEVGRRLERGEGPDGIVATLRASPGLRPLLWGNEPGRRAVTLPAPLEHDIGEGRGGLPRPLAERLAEAARQACAGVALPVLVVGDGVARGAVRAALSAAMPDLPVLSRSERGGAR